MKLSNKIFNDNSDEENEEEDDEEIEEEQSQDDADADDNDEEEEDGDEGDEDEGDEDEEGDEVEDDEDFVEDSENVAPNTIDKKDAAVARHSLGGGNKKIVLKKTSSSSSKKPKTQKLVDEAISQLNERGGSSSEAIKKYIISKYPELDAKLLKRQMKRYVKNCITDGTMIQIKRSFKLTNKHELKKKQQDKEKAIKKKEKEKLKIEKKREKKREEKKNPSKKKSDEKSKEKNKTAKRPKAEVIDDAKTILAKKPKLDKTKKMPASPPSDDKAEKKKSQKPKIKLGRKSINLVVRPTPPRPKTMKKIKATTVAGKKKIDFPASTENAATNAATSTVKATGKGKKK